MSLHTCTLIFIEINIHMHIPVSLDLKTIDSVHTPVLTIKLVCQLSHIVTYQ